MGRRIAGLLGGIMIGGAVLILIFRAPGDSLSQDNLQTARIRWEKSGPKNYDMEIVVTGAQDNTHRIEVRDWKVVRMETGGVEVASKSAHAAWSVEGMFDARRLRRAPRLPPALSAPRRRPEKQHRMGGALV
jgi:hypothetical protein